MSEIARRGSRGSEDSPLLGRADSGEKYSDTTVFIVTVGFLFAVAICGLTIISYGDNIEGLATQVGVSSSVELGGVFIARGVASLIGCLIYPYCASRFTGLYTLLAAFVGFMITALWTAFNTNVIVLYFLYFLVGIFISLINTGSVAFIRKIHGKNAAPWLSASMMLFSLFGTVSAALQSISSNIVFNFTVIAIVGFLSFAWLLVQPNVENYYTQKEEESNMQMDVSGSDHYWVEALCAFGLFCTVGSITVSTAYLETYVDETGVTASSQGPYMLIAFFLGETLSEGLLVVEQSLLGVGLTKLYAEHIGLVAICVTCCVLVVSQPSSAAILWTSVVLFGTLNGPTPGLIFAMCNQLTKSSEQSTAVLMVGMCLGEGFTPYGGARLKATIVE